MTSILSAPDVQAFRALAQEYCLLLETPGMQAPVDWLAAIHRILPKLYAAALLLPDVSPDTNGETPSAPPDPLSKDVTDRLNETLGRWNFYWEVFDPYDEGDREPVCGSLAADLSEIYDDLRDGLAHERQAADSNPNDVLWDWRFAFVSHWSSHATRALRALQVAFHAHYAAQLPETFGVQRVGGIPPAI